MKVINGQKFKMLVLSATNNLYNHYPEINALNVFPVPDGDTGMNMNLTMSSGAKEISNRNDKSIYEIAKTFSRGLLMGARGNSGVITSQIFRGFADALKDKEEINVFELAEAFDNSRKVAYKAVIKPVEGTILTVIRESSAYLLSHVNEKMSIEDSLEMILNEARQSLERTPNLLPVLKEVGVVDSGGAGLVKILEGMYSAINGDFIEKSSVTAIEEEEEIEDSKEELNYKLSFILKIIKEGKKTFQLNRFTSVINGYGKSVKIENIDDFVKVSIITSNPGNILNYVQNFGNIFDLSMNNTSAISYKEKFLGKASESVEDKPVTSDETSSTASINEIVENKKEFVPKNDYAIIATSSGAGIDKLFNEVGVEYICAGGQTMNPSTQDFLELIKQANAKIVYILPNNGNIILAANQAKDVMQGIVDVVVIPTKTIMQGVVSAMMFTPDLSKKDNIEAMTEAISTVKSGAVTFSIKDTDINGVKVSKDEFMAIKESKDIISCQKEKIDALKSLLESMVNADSAIITVLIGKDVTNDEEVNVRNALSEEYKDLDVDVRRGDQPIYSFIVGVE